jgi:hypothetical protein
MRHWLLLLFTIIKLCATAQYTTHLQWHVPTVNNINSTTVSLMSSTSNGNTYLVQASGNGTQVVHVYNTNGSTQATLTLPSDTCTSCNRQYTLLQAIGNTAYALAYDSTGIIVSTIYNTTVTSTQYIATPCYSKPNMYIGNNATHYIGFASKADTISTIASTNCIAVLDSASTITQLIHLPQSIDTITFATITNTPLDIQVLNAGRIMLLYQQQVGNVFTINALLANTTWDTVQYNNTILSNCQNSTLNSQNYIAHYQDSIVYIGATICGTAQVIYWHIDSAKILHNDTITSDSAYLATANVMYHNNNIYLSANKYYYYYNAVQGVYVLSDYTPTIIKYSIADSIASIYTYYNVPATSVNINRSGVHHSALCNGNIYLGCYALRGTALGYFVNYINSSNGNILWYDSVLLDSPAPVLASSNTLCDMHVHYTSLANINPNSYLNKYNNGLYFYNNIPSYASTINAVVYYQNNKVLLQLGNKYTVQLFDVNGHKLTQFACAGIVDVKQYLPNYSGIAIIKISDDKSVLVQKIIVN